MKARDIAAVFSMALGTAALTVLISLGGSLNADDREKSADNVIQPKLKSQGVEFSLTAAADQVFKSGIEPALLLKAVNTGDSATNASVEIVMNASAPVSKFSRMISIPKPIWRHRCSVALGPHETKTLQLATATQLPPNQTIEIILTPPNPQQSADIVKAGPGGVRYVSAENLGELAAVRARVASSQAQSGFPTVNDLTFPNAVVALTFSTVPPPQNNNAAAVK